MSIPINKYAKSYLDKKIKNVKDLLLEMFEEKTQLRNQGDIRENGGLDLINESIKITTKRLEDLTKFINQVSVVDDNVAKVGSKITLDDGTRIVITLFKTLTNKENSELLISCELRLAKDLFYKKEGDEHTYSLKNISKNTKISSIIDLEDMFELLER